MWSFIVLFFFFFKQKTAYEMRISDWSSDVCSSDLQETYPETAMRVPGNVFYNGYMATRELLRAIERTGSTNNIAIIKALEGLKMPAEDRMQQFDAWIDADNHHVEQTVYIAGAQDKVVWEKNTDDMYKIVGQVEPEAARDLDAAAA